ncbi:MAG: aminoacyl-tRNA deacylase [Candidatus Nanohaloarchaea archaeon]
MDRYFNQDTSEIELFLDFMDQDLENVRRAVNDIEVNDIEAEFIVHAKAETVDESAENTGVEKDEIVKTLVFNAGEPVAVLCPGDKRVSEKKLSDITGEKVSMASPSEVRDSTGYYVGGVSPFDLDIPVYMEESILDSERAKPAAGSRVVGVTLDPEDLKELTDAEVVEVAE